MMQKSYMFSLDYGNRVEEKEFIKDILNNFDLSTLVGCALLVNNNIYSLEFLLFLSFKKDTDRFENFIKEKYNEKKRIFNYFFSDAYESIAKRGYNISTLIDEQTVDLYVTEEPNGLFQFPGRPTFNSIWKSEFNEPRTHKIFLSHSSKDNAMIDKIFNEFQKSEISAWYDKYEIMPGDSITDRINKGLDESEIGIICISNNFLNSSSGWTKGELNYFVQRRMNNPDKKFIIVNIDVSHNELPPLVQDYKYVNYNDPDSMKSLIEVIKNTIDR